MSNVPRFLMPRGNPPCYKCLDRVVGCHAECEKYLQYIAERKTQKKEMQKILKKEHMLEDHMIKTSIKHKKRRNGRV